MIMILCGWGRRLPAYLWGIETDKQLVLKSCYDLLPAYLWGIETFLFWLRYTWRRRYQPTYEELKPLMQAIPTNRQIGYQPTYEELKQFSHLNISIYRFCYQPTYEELKLQLIRASPFSSSSLPAYLWGIETAAGLWTGIELLGYQPTYEELKPSSSPSGVSAWLCYQPTYEELKQVFREVGEGWCNGYQPTYEELKPRHTTTGWRLILVTSLPMRNWNRSTR